MQEVHELQNSGIVRERTQALEEEVYLGKRRIYLPSLKQKILNRPHSSKVWTLRSPALRQLSNVPRHGGRPCFYSQGWRPTTAAGSLPRSRECQSARENVQKTDQYANDFNSYESFVSPRPKTTSKARRYPCSLPSIHQDETICAISKERPTALPNIPRERADTNNEDEKKPAANNDLQFEMTLSSREPVHINPELNTEPVENNRPLNKEKKSRISPQLQFPPVQSSQDAIGSSVEETGNTIGQPVIPIEDTIGQEFSSIAKEEMEKLMSQYNIDNTIRYLEFQGGKSDHLGANTSKRDCGSTIETSEGYDITNGNKRCADHESVDTGDMTVIPEPNVINDVTRKPQKVTESDDETNYADSNMVTSQTPLESENSGVPQKHSLSEERCAVSLNNESTSNGVAGEILQKEMDMHVSVSGVDVGLNVGPKEQGDTSSTFTTNSTKKLNENSAQREEDNADIETAADDKKVTRATPDDIYSDVLSGELGHIPSLPSKAVRIFLSSTFSDFQDERNQLAREVFPALRDYCSERGLEFSVMDMRWGVTDEAVSEHMTTELCLAEIRRCQQVSEAINFIALLGNRYGYLPLPNEITEESFDVFMSIASKERLDNAHLLPEWYKKDCNSVPPVYVLQSVKSKIKHFADNNPENADLRNEASAEWAKVSENLRSLITRIIACAVQKNMISENYKHILLNSVTEKEIKKGIIDQPDSGIQTRVYMRHLIGLKDDMGNRLSGKFIDTMTADGLQVMNVECQTSLEALKNQICAKLDPPCIRNYEALWQQNGLSIDNCSDNSSYLTKFCHDFLEDVKKNIDIKFNVPEVAAVPDLVFEIAKHSTFCLQKCETFCGREDTLQTVWDYLISDSDVKKPLVIYGPSGIGKTSVMAMIAKHCRKWMGKHCVCVLRFLGTTRESSNILAVLLSVCNQICIQYNNVVTPSEGERTDSELLFKYFSNLLQELSASGQLKTKPLLVILDSIDQLSAVGGAYGMTWLPRLCSPGINIVISLLPEENNIMKSLKRQLKESECYLEIKPLPIQTAEEIVRRTLSDHKRSLTDNQFQLVMKSCMTSSDPLFLKLLVDEVIRWTSYHEPREDEMAVCSTEAINLRFSKLESLLGKTLVKYALAYITVSGGLSETELEDVLSCNNLVLDEVYQYHDPPDGDSVRIPGLLFSRVRYEIREYLVEREHYGKTVIDWYHRLFRETAKSRYVKCEEDFYSYNRDLAELFRAVSGVQKAITLTQRNLTFENADRRITPQSLHPTNKRKLNILPWLLYKSGPYGSIKHELKDAIHCNFDWLLTKLTSFPLSAVISDCLMIKEPDAEIKIMRDFLNIASIPISAHPDYLAVEAVARLSGRFRQHSHVQQFIHSAQEWISRSTRPTLVPLHQCLSSPGGILNSTLQGPTHLLGLYENHIAVIWSKSMGLQIWDTDVGELMYFLFDVVSSHDVHLSTDSRCVFHTDASRVIGWDVPSGTQSHCIDLFPSQPILQNYVSDESKGFRSILKIMALSAAGSLIAVRVNNNELLLEDDRKGLFIFDLKTRSELCRVTGYRDGISNVAFTNDAKMFIVSHPVSEFSTTIRIYGIEGQILQEFSENITTITMSLLVSHDDTLAVFPCKPNDLLIYHMPSRRIVGDIKSVTWKTIVDTYILRSGYILTLAYDRKLKSTEINIWEMEKQSPVKTISSDGNEPKCLAVSPCESVCAIGRKETGLVEIWLLELSQKVFSIEAHSRDINRILFSSDMKKLFTTSSEATLKIWDLDTLMPSKSVSISEENVDDNNTDKVYEKVKGAATDSVTDNSNHTEERTENVTRTSHLEQHETHVTAHMQNHITVASVGEADRSFQMKNHHESHITVETNFENTKSQPEPKLDLFLQEEESPSDPSHDGKANESEAELEFPRVSSMEKVTDINKDSETENISKNISMVLVNSGRNEIVTAYDRRLPVIWDAAEGLAIDTLRAEYSGVPVILSAHDGDVIVGLAHHENTGMKKVGKFELVSWDFRTRRLNSVEKTYADTCSLTYNTQQVALLQRTTSGSAILICEARSMTNVVKVEFQNRINASHLEISPSGKYAVTSFAGGQVLAWDLKPNVDNKTRTGFNVITKIATVITHSGVAITGANYGALVLWKVDEVTKIPNIKKCQGKAQLAELEKAKSNASGLLSFASEAHSREVASLLLCNKDQNLVSASVDGSVCFWNIRNVDIEFVRSFPGHTDKIRCMDVSSDQTLLASGSRDRTVRIWKIADGREICRFHLDADAFFVKFCMDDTRLVVLTYLHGHRKIIFLEFRNIPRTLT